MSTNGRLEFQIGQAFPADDDVARFVARLSMALGDLRVAMNMLTREHQPDYERIYFFRLVALHLRELVVLVVPFERPKQPAPCPCCGKPEARPEHRLPSVDELISATNADPQKAKSLRDAHAAISAALAERLPLRQALLRQELRRLRNGFAHYHTDPGSDATLTAAMEASADRRSGYRVDANELRADYADEIVASIVDPLDSDEQVNELHDRIVALLSPIAHYLHLAEHLWLVSRPDGVVEWVADSAT